MNIDWLNAEDEYFDSVLEEGRVYAIVKLPDGRQIVARCDSTSDGIGWPSYFLPETLRMEWIGGDELTAAEANTDLGGEYLHEYVLDQLAK